jgi:regulator of RNase E activity RraA
VLTLLTFCPPGPLLREVLKISSSSEINVLFVISIIASVSGHSPRPIIEIYQMGCNNQQLTNARAITTASKKLICTTAFYLESPRKDTEHYTHRFIGIAVTARYVPTNKPPAPAMGTEAFDRWVGRWYSDLSSEPFVPLIRKGTALVFDDAPDSDVGSIGSNNIMGWKLRGCVGVVTNATARDTDEIATEKVPLYFRRPGRGIRPGRNEIESVNRPIVCGGVLVEPGDVIMADGDGVIVVPRGRAKEVAQYAQAVIKIDKAGRRNLYKKLGLAPDDSVK